MDIPISPRSKAVTKSLHYTGASDTCKVDFFLRSRTSCEYWKADSTRSMTMTEQRAILGQQNSYQARPIRAKNCWQRSRKPSTLMVRLNYQLNIDREFMC